VKHQITKVIALCCNLESHLQVILANSGIIVYWNTAGWVYKWSGWF